MIFFSNSTIFMVEVLEFSYRQIEPTARIEATARIATPLAKSCKVLIEATSGIYLLGGGFTSKRQNLKKKIPFVKNRVPTPHPKLSLWCAKKSV